MPRIPEKDLNYAEVGRWVLEYWKNEDFAGELENRIRQKVVDAYGKAADAGDPPEVKVIFEQEGEFCVVIPRNPWYSDPDCLRCAEALEAYQRELGLVVYGGCR